MGINNNSTKRFTSVILHRRTFLTGLASIIAAPAIVRASSLMPVKSFYRWQEFELGPMSVLVTPWQYAELSRLTRQAFLPKLYERARLLVPPQS